MLWEKVIQILKESVLMGIVSREVLSLAHMLECDYMSWVVPEVPVEKLLCHMSNAIVTVVL